MIAVLTRITNIYEEYFFMNKHPHIVIVDDGETLLDVIQKALRMTMHARHSRMQRTLFATFQKTFVICLSRILSCSDQHRQAVYDYNNPCTIDGLLQISDTGCTSTSIRRGIRPS